MKKNLLFLLAMIITGFAITSCGGGAGKSPGDTVQSFFSALDKQDYDKAVSLLVKKDGTHLTDEEKSKATLLLPEGRKELEENEGLKEIKIINVEIAEDEKSAKVEYEIIFNNGETDGETDKLLNVDGRWYMIFNN